MPVLSKLNLQRELCLTTHTFLVKREVESLCQITEQVSGSHSQTLPYALNSIFSRTSKSVHVLSPKSCLTSENIKNPCTRGLAEHGMNMA